jgi:hypothetical protein
MTVLAERLTFGASTAVSAAAAGPFAIAWYLTDPLMFVAIRTPWASTLSVR